MADLISMLSACGATEGEATDEYFQNTTLLLHGDGTNGAQNNTFLDSSTNNFTITRNGNTTQGTFSPFSKVDGRWGNYFDGTDDGIQVPSPIIPATNDFTLEGWFYLTDYSVRREIFFQNSTSASNDGRLFVYVITTGELRAFIGGTNLPGSITTTSVVQTNAWNHFALVRNGNTFTLYLNGVSEASGSGSGSITQENVRIGNHSVSGTEYFWSGYLSNIRATNTVVYSSGFTPSSSPLTAISGTLLLTCQSNRFVDNSTNAYALTLISNPKVTPFSPFPTLTAYDAATNGGSGYFDGSGDRLDVTDTSNDLDLGGVQASLDLWFYASDLTNAQTFLQKIGTSNSFNATDGIEYALRISSGVGFSFYTSGTSNNVISTANAKANQWNHVCVATDTSNNIALFLNGVREATASDAIGKPTTRTSVYVGNNIASTASFNGYMSGLRFLTGANAYDPTQTTITIPTAPPTNVSGTELLLNYTNAGIIDNSMSNNLETVGNAQIDTTTKKYGTGSLEFDGTGDWLTIANTPDLQLGTGNFTVEFWVYLATGDTGSNRGLVGKGGASTGWLVSLNTTQKVVFTYASSTITSSGAITTNAWNHIAVVREGTGSNQTKIYIGGTNDGTGTVSTDFNQTEIMYVGANRTGGDPMKGFIDDLRITKGIARYTAAFTPPTAAFPDIGE